MGTTCNLGPARETISEVSQGARAAERLAIGANKPNRGYGIDKNEPPAPVKKRGLRERAAGILDRFAERVKPEEDRERRRSLTPSPEKPDGPTSGKLPERRRIQTERPATPKPPSPPVRAASAATDNAKKQNIKNNGRNIPGSQFGQNFGSEQSAKKQAIDAAKRYNKQVYIIKTEGAAKRPYRVVDEDRARVARNGAVIGVVDEKGNHRPIEAPDLTPSEAIDEIKKDVEFGKPMGPNGPNGPKTPKPKTISQPPSDNRKNQYPKILKDLTQEERDQLDRANKELEKINKTRKELIDQFVDAGSEEDVQKQIKRIQKHIEELEQRNKVFLERWRNGEDGAALDYWETQSFIEHDQLVISYAESALELARIKKENLRDAREEADRIQREQEEIDRRAAEVIPEVKPAEIPEADKPVGPRPVSVGEIFEPPKPKLPTRPEPNIPANPPQGVPEEAALKVKALLDPNTMGYRDDLFDVTHGNTVVNGFNIPTQVSVGNMGINDIDGAIDHLVNGGSLDDVPDEFLRDAIMSSLDDERFLSSKATSPRFKLIADSPGGGINAIYAGGQFGGTYIVEDLKTGRKYIVKSPTAFNGEFVNEVYGQYMQQLLGTHTVRIRVAGYDPENSNNGNLPIVMEHFGDVIAGDVLGDGETWNQREFFLTDTSFNSVSKDMIVLMDAVMENPDRHFKNWLFTEFNGEKVVLGIDNGASGAEGGYPPGIAEMRSYINEAIGYATEPQAMQELLDNINVNQAVTALEALEESLTNMIERHDDPMWVQSEMADLAVTRIRNFLSALEEIQNRNR